MMIRSAPPASANLAEMPVPAPAPTMGLPLGDLALQAVEHLLAGVPHRLSISRRAPGGGPGEGVVVDVAVQLVDAGCPSGGGA